MEREFTVIVAFGLPNDCAVYKLLNKFSKEATNLNGNIYLIELADGGMYALSILAQNLISWYLGFQDLVYAALDIESSQRSACFQVNLLSRDTAGNFADLARLQAIRPQGRY